MGKEHGSVVSQGGYARTGHSPNRHNSYLRITRSLIRRHIPVILHHLDFAHRARAKNARAGWNAVSPLTPSGSCAGWPKRITVTCAVVGTITLLHRQASRLPLGRRIFPRIWFNASWSGKPRINTASGVAVTPSNRIVNGPACPPPPHPRTRAYSAIRFRLVHVIACRRLQRKHRHVALAPAYKNIAPARPASTHRGKPRSPSPTAVPPTATSPSTRAADPHPGPANGHRPFTSPRANDASADSHSES